MVGLKCCVHGCYNTSTYTSVTFFSFPSDIDKWSLWLHLIGRQDLVEKFQNGNTSRSYRVCSDHFKEENYIYRKILKQNVVPTRNLPVPLQLPAIVTTTPAPEPEGGTSTNQTEQLVKKSPSIDSLSKNAKEPEKAGRDAAKSEMQITFFVQPPEQGSEQGATLIIPNQAAIVTPSDDTVQAGQDNTGSELLQLDQSLENITCDHLQVTTCDQLTLTEAVEPKPSDTPTKRKIKDESLMQKKIKMEKSYNPLDPKNEAEPRPVAMKKFLEYCDRFLDERMAHIVKCHARMVEKFKGNRYTMEFKLFALNLYFRCPQSYQFLEKYFHLPSIRTLQRMHIPVSSGLNTHFLKALESKLQCMSEKDKVCVVCVDSITLKPHDPSKEKKNNNAQEIENLVGAETARYALVIMANGLFTKWQQPIAFELKPDNTNYTELTQWIDNVIGTLLGIGLDVRALTSDLSWDFYNSAKLRNISKDQTFFHVNGHKIYYIFDAPHLIKCARNNLMQYDFNFGPKIARWAHIEAIFERDSAHELKLMPKITEKHIKPNNVDKLNIKYATQIFSYTVAAAMQFYVKARLIETGANDTKDLIKMFNDIFDVLNSEAVTSDYFHKRAYKGNCEQKKFLTEALNFLESLILIEPASNKMVNNVEFIEGFIVSLKSVMCLHDDLKQHGHTYISTRNLNQDCLDEFFSQIRLTCKEPTALQFSRAFRNLFLSNILKTTSTNKEVNYDDDLTSILFKLNDLKDTSTSSTTPVE